jgi:LPS-assembly protein
MARVPTQRLFSLAAKGVLLFTLASPALAQVASAPHEDLYRSSCGLSRGIPLAPAHGSDLKTLLLGTTEINADQGYSEQSSGYTRFVGNADLVRGQQAVSGSEVRYDQSSSRAVALGHVRYWDPDLFWQGRRAMVNLDEGVARFEDGDYWMLKSDEAKGHAARIDADNRTNVSVLSGVDYTTCAGPRPDWKLSATTLTVDENNSTISARNAVLWIKNFPVFYTPYLSLPLTNERTSGFLLPTLGDNSRSGYYSWIPYYWNIAPNLDATLGPEFYSERGTMANGNVRYMWNGMSGTISAQVLPSDNKYTSDQTHNSIAAGTSTASAQPSRPRYLLTANQKQPLPFGGIGHINFSQVSDKDYFGDFGQQLAITSTRFLTREADINFSGNTLGHSWSLFSQALSYQVVDPTFIGTSPYRTLPLTNLTIFSPARNNFLNWGLRGNGTYFSQPTMTSGARLNVEPEVSFPSYGQSYFVLPRASLKHTEYFLDPKYSAIPGVPVTMGSTTPNTPSYISRTLPVASFDSGLYFDKEMTFGDAHYAHTIEPRAYYVYVPYKNQDNIPLFDTSLFDQSMFSSLFRPERFNGADRVGDANQVTLSVRSRLLDRDEGMELLRLTAGTIFYFNDRRITLPTIMSSPILANATLHGQTSAYLGELRSQITRSTTLGGTLQYDPNLQRYLKQSIDFQYRPAENTVFNGRFYFHNNTTLLSGLNNYNTGSLVSVLAAQKNVDQTDISFRLPVTDSLRLVGRWLYSLPKANPPPTAASNSTSLLSVFGGQSLEAFGGIEYGSCCWGVRILGRQYLQNQGISAAFPQGKLEYASAVYVQFQLRGFANSGADDTFQLTQFIPGFNNAADPF